MEYFPKNENNNILHSSSFILKNKNLDYSINDISTENKKNISASDNIERNTNGKNNSLMNKSLFYTYSNMFGYMNYSRPMSTRVNSLLIDFNKELSKNYSKNKEKDPKLDFNQNQLKNQYSKITHNNYEPLIKKLESIDDERFKKSRFLQFIKDINSNKLIINEEKNIIENNANYINDEQIEENIKDKNELEELLKEAKKYMNYSREDLAKNILETIFDNSNIKIKENKKYLQESYLLLIICYLNENEDLLGITLIIDFFNLINEENNDNNDINYKCLNGHKYLEKEYINTINQRNFDIINKELYDNYISNKIKIHEEIENYIKNKIITNNNESYNEIFLLLYGLILYLNEKYKESEEIFNQLIILDTNNYFYYNILGVICSNEKKYEDSLKYYRKAIEINNEYPKCLINIGVLLSNKGEYEESSKYLISALKIYEDIPECWNHLLTNIIELDKDDFICEINNRNLKNIEQIFEKKYLNNI